PLRPHEGWHTPETWCCCRLPARVMTLTTASSIAANTSEGLSRRWSWRRSHRCLKLPGRGSARRRIASRAARLPVAGGDGNARHYRAPCRIHIEFRGRLPRVRQHQLLRLSSGRVRAAWSGGARCVHALVLLPAARLESADANTGAS